MNTPHAILIGLSLIAAAIFFKETAVKPAHAFGGPDGFACWDSRSCFVMEGNVVHEISIGAAYDGGRNLPLFSYNWRTGKEIK